MEKNDRLFLVVLKLYAAVLLAFTVAILCDLVFNLGFGWRLSDLENVGIMWLIAIGIFLSSRIIKSLLGSL